MPLLAFELQFLDSTLEVVVTFVTSSRELFFITWSTIQGFSLRREWLVHHGLIALLAQEALGMPMLILE